MCGIRKIIPYRTQKRPRNKTHLIQPPNGGKTQNILKQKKKNEEVKATATRASGQRDELWGGEDEGRRR